MALREDVQNQHRTNPDNCVWLLKQIPSQRTKQQQGNPHAEKPAKNGTYYPAWDRPARAGTGAKRPDQVDVKLLLLSMSRSPACN